MLLAIDVGNTSIALGLFRGRRLVRAGRIPTRAADLRRRLSPWLKRAEAVGVSSVVPRATASLKKALRPARRPVFIVGENLTVPILNRYRVPSQVGQDRLVNAAAAFELYGGPAIIADFGTGLTIDLVSARREYRGGVIVPGMQVALDALTARAALLPKITLAPPREFLGRDTRSSMRSGLFYGYAALCDGIVAGLKKIAPGAKVIGTGGHCGPIAPFCRTLKIVNPHLTLQGLELTYRLSQKNC